MDDYIAKNRADWNATSDEYQHRHGEQLEHPLAWGIWALPERELGVLGDVRGKRILELGCGAAQWSNFLARSGANPIGMDLSERQLAHARRRTTVPLVHANAERAPFRDSTFDIVFCDHGAMGFADPRRTVPEAARLLRPGGIFAFNLLSPLRDFFYDDANDVQTDRPQRNYFDMYRIDSPEDVEFQLPYGDWVRLFRRNELVIEDLIELRPPEDAVSTYLGFDSLERARTWPVENIWKLRKAL